MIDRRHFILSASALAACGGRTEKAEPVSTPRPKQLAITMDDFNLGFDIRLNPRERNERILAAFDGHNHKAAAFVTGRFVDNPFGNEVVQSWSDAGHLIGNHTYSHMNSSDENSIAVQVDILKNHNFLSQYEGYQNIFRFPFLAEGGTPDRVEEYRAFLDKHGFQNAAVTIDTIDWFVTSRFEKALAQKPDMDVTPYRDYYVQSVLTLAEHFHGLADKVGYGDAPHSMLMHHNILNALFLDDVLTALENKGWELIDATRMFEHPLYRYRPSIPNRGRSILSVLSEEQALGDTGYPDAYRGFGEKTMDALGL